MRLRKPWRPVELTCEQARAELPLVLEGDAPASGPLVAHVERCLGCQAELARYRRLVRLLHQLKTSDIEPPAGLVGEVLAVLEKAANRRVVRSLLTGRRAAYAGALLGAGGAAAGLIALARSHLRVVKLGRHRRRLSWR
jgi:anti-sigma factor RsiW